MDIIYRAFDGKEFDNEDDCELYEKLERYPASSMNFKLFDANGKPITVSKDNIYDIKPFEYIKTHNAEEARMAHEIFNTVGLCSPWDEDDDVKPFEYGAGCYYYDHREFEWKDFACFEKRYQSIKSMFEGE